MVYEVQVTPQPQRAAALREMQETPVRTIREHNLGNGTDLKVVRVPIGLPAYRMENGRTLTSQMEYLDKTGKPEDFFAHGQENESVQQTQHDILVSFAKRPASDDAPSILDVLREKGQTDYLLITKDGVVLNGNRRLSAMRELYNENPRQFSRFESVEVAVLPGLDEEALLALEMRLQTTPDTLLPYTWIDEALAFRNAMQSTGKSESEIAAWNGRTVQDIRQVLRSLDEADRYLSVLGKSRAYHLVKDKKQLFGDLAKKLKNIGEVEANAARVTMWAVDQDEERTGRVYAAMPLVEDPIAIVQAVEAAGVVLPKVADHSDEVDFGGDDGPNLSGLFQAVVDPATREATIAAIQDVADGLLQKRAAEKNAGKPKKIVQQALTAVATLDIASAPHADLPVVIGQLKELVLKASALRDAAESRLEG